MTCAILRWASGNVYRGTRTNKGRVALSRRTRPLGIFPAQEKHMAQHAQWKQSISDALDGTHPRLGHIVGLAIQTLVVISLIAIGVETLPNLTPQARALLWALEVVVVAVFTVEYAVRIWVAPKPWRYVFSFWGIVDLLAILPFYLLFVIDFRWIRILRLLRLLRILKIAHYSSAAERILMAMRLIAPELLVFALVAAIVTYFCAFGIYFFEHPVQPEKFASVFHAMWWAAITLTTVGYGDMYPVTLGGRIFTMLMLFVALGVVAVPTGLVASALSHFREEERRRKAEERARKHASE
jgi:voltage-gated potassium channel